MAGGGSSGFGSGLWVADIEKMYLGEYWTNRYIIAAASLVDAATVASQIVGAERAIHMLQVLFTRYRVSDGAPNTDVYQVNNLNSYGTVDAETQYILPLFNVCRCDFNVAGGGRPSRKYLRGVYSEADISYNSVNAAKVAAIQTNFVNPLVALAGYVDVDGQEIVAGSVYPQVAMRQLRRASKRKAPTSGTSV
jgi:hypothetical protein